LGVTGIAGPTGATEEKPVGLVYIALSDAQKTES
jgi:nicotinamide-nucleotide amidase